MNTKPQPWNQQSNHDHLKSREKGDGDEHDYEKSCLQQLDCPTTKSPKQLI
jgi:hypothetical protein